MNENETEEMEVIDVESVGSLDDLIDEVLKERGLFVVLVIMIKL